MLQTHRYTWEVTILVSFIAVSWFGDRGRGCLGSDSHGVKDSANILSLMYVRLISTKYYTKCKDKNKQYTVALVDLQVHHAR